MGKDKDKDKGKGKGESGLVVTLWWKVGLGTPTGGGAAASVSSRRG